MKEIALGGFMPGDLDSIDPSRSEDRTAQMRCFPSRPRNAHDNVILKEIYEQPETVSLTLRGWIDNPQRLFDELGLTIKMVLGLRRLHIVSCGTSYHAGLVGRHIIERLARIPVDVAVSSEYRNTKPLIEKGTLFISISRSGETADTLAAKREARDRGARTLTICNVAGSTSAREADSVLYTRAGPETRAVSTKAFTAQLAALCLLGIVLGIKCGKLSNGEASTLKSQLSKIPDLIGKALSTDSEIKNIAHSLIYAKDFFYIGRGIHYPIAMEGALKIKELSHAHAEGYFAGEMKHGPIALIEEGTPVIVITPVDELFEKTLSNIEEVRARKGRVIVVTDEPSRLKENANDIVEVPATHPMLAPFLSVIPLQLLGCHIGEIKECSIRHR
jgi:glucosamine--fructose-6-phosphate aminotransferase (isomerizing)